MPATPSCPPWCTNHDETENRAELPANERMIHHSRTIAPIVPVDLGLFAIDYPGTGERLGPRVLLEGQPLTAHQARELAAALMELAGVIEG